MLEPLRPADRQRAGSQWLLPAAWCPPSADPAAASPIPPARGAAAPFAPAGGHSHCSAAPGPASRGHDLEWPISHLEIPLRLVGEVAAVVKDVLRRPLDVGFGLDHRQAATPTGQHQGVQGDPLLRCAAGDRSPRRSQHGGATDRVGRQLAQATSRGTRTSDHQELIGWARQRWPERPGRSRTADTWPPGCWGICWQLVLVPPRLMATARQASRVPGKSDPIDALAVARAALQEPKLPQARLDGPARELNRVAQVCPRLLSLPGVGR